MILPLKPGQSFCLRYLLHRDSAEQVLQKWFDQRSEPRFFIIIKTDLLNSHVVY